MECCVRCINPPTRVWLNNLKNIVQIQSELPRVQQKLRSRSYPLKQLLSLCSVSIYTHTYAYMYVNVLHVLESNILNFMALILFLILSLCITCCRVDARSKTLSDEQKQSTLSKTIMVLSLIYCPFLIWFIHDLVNCNYVCKSSIQWTIILIVLISTSNLLYNIRY